jgi:hypothetical protein
VPEKVPTRGWTTAVGCSRRASFADLLTDHDPGAEFLGE